MKKLIIVLMLAGIVWGQQPKPRWHNPDAWRKKLRVGLAEKAVLSILGKPAYIHVTYLSTENSYDWSTSYRMKTTWYYGKPPKCVPVEERDKSRPGNPKLKLEHPKSARVIFQGKTRWEGTAGRPSYAKPKRPERPVYRAERWVEPEVWDNLPGTRGPKRPTKKRRPLRKLQKWENPRAWKKLMVGMPIAAVERFIGEAGHEVQHGLRGEKRWYYGTVFRCGVLTFRDNYLYGWSEPFWPEVDKLLYAPVEEKQVR